MCFLVALRYFSRNLTEFRQKTLYLQSKETSGGAC